MQLLGAIWRRWPRRKRERGAAAGRSPGRGGPGLRCGASARSGRLPAGQPADRGDRGHLPRRRLGHRRQGAAHGSSPPRWRTGCRPGSSSSPSTIGCCPTPACCSRPATWLEPSPSCRSAPRGGRPTRPAWSSSATRRVPTSPALLAADPALAEAKVRRRGWRPTCSTARPSTWWKSCGRRIGRCTTGRSAAPSPVEALSPLHRLRARPAPLLLVHSNRRQDAAGASRRFAAAVAARGGRAEVHEVALSHAEIMPGSAWATNIPSGSIPS